MYSWLRKYFSETLANLLIFIWYLALMLLVFYSIGFEAARFRYLTW
jgi:hypothetical protein